jgi:N-acetylmuramoyl-L-alanine amidase
MFVPRGLQGSCADGDLLIMRFWASRIWIRVCCAGAAAGLVAAQADEQIAAASARQDQLAITAAKPASAAATPSLRTRFVVGLDRKVEYQVFSLANPNRVVVELPDVQLQLPQQVENDPVGLVKSFRGGLAAPGKNRIVLDVTEAVVVESAKIEKDKNGLYRLALDIVAVDAAIRNDPKRSLGQKPFALGAMGLQPPLPKRAESPKARAAKAFRPIIVIDPGHGGMDSGAAKYGTVEKNVVLSFGHELRQQLEKTGRYKVMMTRDKDIFVELDERLAYAERNNANLFIAVHADYAGTKARGATIFSLRDGVAKDLARSARNGSSQKLLSDSDINTVKQSSGDVDTVRDILSDLAERDIALTHERSNVFAKTVIENMGESTTMRDEPDQQAAFRVLKTAQFPSVLIELAYVSNRQDANNLNSDEWRAKVADSIVTAIENYFGNQLAHMPM